MIIKYERGNKKSFNNKKILRNLLKQKYRRINSEEKLYFSSVMFTFDNISKLYVTFRT